MKWRDYICLPLALIATLLYLFLHLAVLLLFTLLYPLALCASVNGFIRTGKFKFKENLHECYCILKGAL